MSARATDKSFVYLDTGEIFEAGVAGVPLGDPVAVLQHGILDDEAHSLGMQMAAAPDLLNALIRLRGNIDAASLARNQYGKQLRDAADAAIAKATGAA